MMSRSECSESEIEAVAPAIAALLAVLVSRIVIDDEMDRKIFGDGLIDAFEETKKLLMAMAWFCIR